MNRKFIGSTVALIIGILAFSGSVAQIANGNSSSDSHSLVGLLIIIGALTYKSLKKRKLGIVNSSKIRYLFEIAALITIVLLVVMQNNLQVRMVNYPFSNVVIPLWAIGAYITLFNKKSEATDLENNELKGLSGWLILVGIGVIFSPIRLLFTSIPIYKQIFEDGTWEALTTVGSEVYNSLWAPLFLGEITYNSIMVAASIYLIYLFFSKHYLFPKLYIAIVALSIVFFPLDAWLATKVLPSEPMFDPETTKEFMQSLVAGIIWIPYMLISKRVKATFVENMPNKQINKDT